MIVRAATLADVPVLAELGAKTFTETFSHLYSRQDLQAYLEEKHSQAAHAAVLADPRIGAWLAFDDAGLPCGFAVAGPCKLPVEGRESEAGELRQVYVLASRQNLGIGRRLMECALEWLAAHFAPLYIGVWSENVGAQRLYARYGFSKVGEYGFPVGDHVDREFIMRRG
jgi:ribosomal protein S18 acetylase RimI-like enzyme